MSPSDTLPVAGRSLAGLLAMALALAVLPLAAGCIPHAAAQSSGRLDQVWGTRGTDKGQFRTPRAVAIDDQDRLYIVDKTGRIQVFTADGEFLRGWRTPDTANGKPSGLSFDRQGNLLVADTHYFRVLVYTPKGRLLPEQSIGGVCGHGPGQFNFVTDAVQDSQGNYYVAEYGDYDRIQKFSPDGQFMFQWGSQGSEPMQFVRPQNLAIDEHDHLWVVDACNHRLQVFDASSPEVRLLRLWGEEGEQPGQLSYPYDLVLDGKGHVFVCEYGNHRVQKFTLDGTSRGVWGSSGRREGELAQPWALVQDSRGRIHVLDTYNHRVQTIRF